MIDLDLARALRDAGLTWTPAAGDRFLVPDRDLDDMLFIGDRLDPAGNDYPVKAMGVACHAVEGWEDTAAYQETLNADLARR